jgi:phosphoenolpyruvate carboxykinase (ATP)
MKLQYTRAMITAALNGSLDNVEYHNHTVFGMAIPFTCPNVPSEILSPKATWNNDEAFYEKTNELANKFIANFRSYEDFANDEIMAGAPTPKVLA